MSGEHHVISLKTYGKILAILLFLTVVTVLAAKPVSGLDFGSLNTFIAMAIASVKATFVLAIFMHLKYDDRLNLVIFGTGVFLLILLFVISVLDIYSRVPEQSTL